MYIEARPKNEIKSLYGRDEEIKSLIRHIDNNEPLILITGFRRVGKTSLLKAVLNDRSYHSVFIDLRNLGYKTHVTKKDMVGLFQKGIQSFLDSQSHKEPLKSILKTVQDIKIPDVEIQFGFTSNDLDLPDLFSALDRLAKNNSTNIVIAIDEAQELRKVKCMNMTSIFVSVYDNCRNTILVLTGSEKGFLDDFVAFDDPDAPLYGRSKKEINLKLLTHEQGMDFFKKALKQRNVKIDEDVIKKAVKELGGIMGWLNDFGLVCIEHNKIDEKFIENVKKTGSKLARKEFEKFLTGRVASKRYTAILSNLSVKPLSWTNLKKLVNSDLEEYVDGRNFSTLLESLQKSGFIQEDNKLYFVTDPLLKYSFEEK